MNSVKNCLIFFSTERPSAQVRTLQSRLSCQGYKVRESFGIQDTLSSLNEELKALIIIVDTSQHCALGGIKKAEKIRQFYPDIPIIMITSHSSEQLAISALKTGLNDYYQEPFSLEELVASIKQLLDAQNKCEPSIKNPAITTVPYSANRIQKTRPDSFTQGLLLFRFMRRSWSNYFTTPSNPSISTNTILEPFPELGPNE